MAPPRVHSLFLLLAGAIWGSSFAVIKIGLDSVDPFYFALLRFILGGTILGVALAAMGRFDRRVFADPVVIALSVINALAFVLQNVGLTATTATNAALLININVGIVAILAAVILRERLTRSTVIGLMIGLAGVLFISTGGDLDSIFQGSFVGDMAVFGAGVLLAVYIVYMKRTLHRQTDVMMVTAAVVIGSAAFLVPLTLLFGGAATFSAGWVWPVIYTGVICTGLAYLLYNFGLQKVRAIDSSILLLVEPIFGILFAVMLLQEWPSPTTVIGGALVLFSIGVISFSNGRGA